MVELWDYYLVYSIAFSISSIASNEMYDFFGKKYSNLKSQNPMEELIFLLANCILNQSAEEVKEPEEVA